MALHGDDGDVVAAWRDFCEMLADAGETVIARSQSADDATRAAGFRHLGQLLSLGLEFFVTNADPEAPEFTSVITPTRKWALDNPDSDYQRAPVSGAHTYRIHGNRGSSRLMLFDINAGLTGTRNIRRQLGHLTSEDIDVAEDGSFEVIVSSEPHSGNWLPLDADVTPRDFGVIVRQYFANRAAETPATFAIERIGESHAAGRADPAAVALGLRHAAGFVCDSLEYWAGVGDALAELPNELLPADFASTAHSGANPDNAYFGGYWRLEADQALVIDLTPQPRAAFWNLYISNQWWEDVDERRFRMNVNSATARPHADGTLRIVLADQEVDALNHLQVGGFTSGLMLFRMTMPEQIPSIRCRVVPASHVGGLA